MKKYVFECAKKQWEKPTQPKAVFAQNAIINVVAASEEDAKAIACKKLCCEYCGTGVLLGDVKLVKTYDLPVDWSYGYGENSKCGCTCSIGDLVCGSQIR